MPALVLLRVSRECIHANGENGANWDVRVAPAVPVGRHWRSDRRTAGLGSCLGTGGSESTVASVGKTFRDLLNLDARTVASGVKFASTAGGAEESVGVEGAGAGVGRA